MSRCLGWGGTHNRLFCIKPNTTIKYVFITLECVLDVNTHGAITEIVAVKCDSSSALVRIFEQFLTFCPVIDATGQRLFGEGGMNNMT